MNVRNAINAITTAAVLAIAALPSPAAPAIGGAAPEFSLPTAGAADSVALKGLVGQGKGVVVFFVSTRCPYSKAYEARMDALAKEYKAKGIAVVGINSNGNEPAAEVAEHAKKTFSFPVLKDASNKVADAYDAKHTPEAFLVDAKGNLVYHGRIDESKDPSGAKSHDLKNAIDAVLGGKAVPVAETKSFGCTIKRA